MAKGLSDKVLNRILSSPKVKASKAAVRNAISTIKRKNPGVTSNAAAFIYADKRGVAVWKQLDSEDRTSLQYRQDTPIKKSSEPTHLSIAKKKTVAPGYGEEFIKDANANASVSPYLYILENSLRSVILAAFQGEPNWWTNPKFVDINTQSYAARIEAAERKYPWVRKRAGHPIYYVGLSELYGIMTKNWSRFENIFKDQGNLRTWFNELIPVRNLVAHNVHTTAAERKNVELRTSFICTTIDNAKSKT